MNNFIHEHATCAAYYVIGSQCIGNRPDAESQALSTRLMQIGVNAAHRANQYGDVLKMSRKTHQARMEMATDMMMKDIENSCSNISIILNKYAKSCQLLMDKPEEALNRFMAGKPLKD